MNQNEVLAKKWLKRAESSLAKAKIGRQSGIIMLEDLCFDAQQACEKALKSLFVLKNKLIPKTHSIGFLLKTLEENGVFLPESIKESAVLTEYAVETRYPGDYEPISDEEYESSVELAELVLDFVKETLQKTGIFDAGEE